MIEKILYINIYTNEMIYSIIERNNTIKVD